MDQQTREGYIINHYQKSSDDDLISEIAHFQAEIERAKWKVDMMRRILEVRKVNAISSIRGEY